MYFEAFSRNVNEVIDMSVALAKKYGCRYIGSEHILYGLIAVSEGRASAILREAGVTSERFLVYFKRSIVSDLVIPGNMFTARTKRVFENAAEISLKSHAGYVGTEHLLLALLLETDSIAVSILRHLKVDVDRMTNDIANSLMSGVEDHSVEDEQDQSFANAIKNAIRQAIFFVNTNINSDICSFAEDYDEKKLIADAEKLYDIE